MGYGLTLPVGRVPYRAWPETCPLVPTMNPCMLNTDQTAGGEMSDAVQDQVTRTLRELRFTPRGRAKAYHKPYPEYFDMIPYPMCF
jgi:hypothetical protein